jgi:transposase-like protein
VRQVIDKGHPVVDVAKRLGISDQLLYKWVKKFKDTNQPVAIDDMKSMGNRPLEPRALEVEFFPMQEVLHEKVKIH